MSYEIEKNKLEKHVNGNDVLALLAKAKCFIAGGAITSIFSNKDINDVDVYFRDFNSLKLVLKSLFCVDDDDGSDYFDISSFSAVYSNHTKKSIMFTKNNLNLQLIYFKFFNSPQEIFDTYDFTVNMGAYDCEKDEFVFHPDFMKDLAQRRLTINTNTAFPIISMLRVEKYRERGYSISRKDVVKLCLAINKCDFKSWEEVAEAMGGMYGYDYTDIFDVKKEFSIDETIRQLEKLESNLMNYSSPKSKDYYELIDSIRVNLKLDPEPLPRTFFKKVLRTEDPNVFKSYYYQNYRYVTGQIGNGGASGVWVYNSRRKAFKHFVSNDKSKEAVIALQSENDVERSLFSFDSMQLMGNYTVLGEVKIDEN
jgi:hypothetical protein